MEDNIFKGVEKSQLKNFYIDLKKIEEGGSRKTNSFLLLLSSIECNDTIKTDKYKFRFLKNQLVTEIINRYFNLKYN
ncbi:hypothetical protein [Lactococcus lactis]|uniref:Uncharacterized protein n=1 Tax=Lactococcus lactis TaxID=1358 RepID=A0AAW5TUK7_9LACT|nr:hypothetical protein [Lactococcus lactis]MCW2281952.1 hypothetical protein [Lactococcus lactis]